MYKTPSFKRSISDNMAIIVLTMAIMGMMFGALASNY
jgi:phage-related minor tail protein